MRRIAWIEFFPKNSLEKMFSQTYLLERLVSKEFLEKNAFKESLERISLKTENKNWRNIVSHELSGQNSPEFVENNSFNRKIPFRDFSQKRVEWIASVFSKRCPKNFWVAICQRLARPFSRTSTLGILSAVFSAPFRGVSSRGEFPVDKQRFLHARIHECRRRRRRRWWAEF